MKVLFVRVVICGGCYGEVGCGVKNFEVLVVFDIF